MSLKRKRGEAEETPETQGATARLPALPPVTNTTNTTTNFISHAQPGLPFPPTAEIHALMACINAAAPGTQTTINRDQLRVLHHALVAQQDLLWVAATGSGKNTLVIALAAATSPSKTTVLVLPLRALQADMERRTATLPGALNWRGVPPARTPTLIIVSSEDFIGFEAQRYLHQLRSTGKLARIVVDEAHLYLTSAFRQGFRGVLHFVTQVAVPRLYLTATLPPHLELALQEELADTPFSTIRGPCHRPNLAYSVIMTSSSSAMLQKACDLLEEAVAEYEDGRERAIVFVMGRELAGTVKAMLPGGFRAGIYHGGLETAEKDEALAKWRGGDWLAVVGTSGFGTGLDYPYVRDVIIIGGAYSLLDLSQLSGRAGRARQLEGRVHLVTCESYLEGLSRSEEPGFQLVRNWIRDSTRCRRQTLETYLDGTETPCCLMGEASRCDVCESGPLLFIPLLSPTLCSPRLSPPSNERRGSPGNSTITITTTTRRRHYHHHHHHRQKQQQQQQQQQQIQRHEQRQQQQQTAGGCIG